MIKYLNYIALITSITIAGIAAYFSVIGMATIFAGAYLGTIVMMTALEVGKLVTAAYLHLAWDKMNYLKWYLLTSVGVLKLSSFTIPNGANTSGLSSSKIKNDLSIIFEVLK